MKIKEYYQKILKFCSTDPLIIDFHLDFEEIDANVGYGFAKSHRQNKGVYLICLKNS